MQDSFDTGAKLRHASIIAQYLVGRDTSLAEELADRGLGALAGDPQFERMIADRIFRRRDRRSGFDVSIWVAQPHVGNVEPR